jgi:hypothetical protein
MKLCKARSLCGEAVDVRRGNFFISGDAQIAVAEVVDQNENDVGFVSGVYETSCEQKQNRKRTNQAEFHAQILGRRKAGGK